MHDLITLEKGSLILNEEFAAKLAEFERKTKEIKDAEEKLKAAILEEMERKQILKVESNEVSITYVAATDREVFDSKAFKAEFPTVYDDFVKISKIRPSVRIRVK